MPTIGSETKAARIRKEDLEILNPQLKDISFSEWVHRQINHGGNVDTRVYADIEMSCMIFGVTVDKFLRDLCTAINNGDIVYEHGKFEKMA